MLLSSQLPEGIERMLEHREQHQMKTSGADRGHCIQGIFNGNEHGN